MSSQEEVGSLIFAVKVTEVVKNLLCGKAPEAGSDPASVSKAFGCCGTILKITRKACQPMAKYTVPYSPFS